MLSPCSASRAGSLSHGQDRSSLPSRRERTVRGRPRDPRSATASEIHRVCDDQVELMSRARRPPLRIDNRDGPREDFEPPRNEVSNQLGKRTFAPRSDQRRVRCSRREQTSLRVEALAQQVRQFHRRCAWPSSTPRLDGSHHVTRCLSTIHRPRWIINGRAQLVPLGHSSAAENVRTSSIDAAPVASMTRRSKPSAIPADGGSPSASAAISLSSIG